MGEVKRILMGHTLFIVVMVALTATIGVMLGYAQFFADRDKPDIEHIMAEEFYRPTVTFPLTLHASIDFSHNQMQSLRAAAWVWNDRTKGRADIRIVPWLPAVPFSEDVYKDHEKYTIWLLDGNDKDVAILWAKYSAKMAGLAVGKFVGIMSDERPEDFSVIAAHEMGHLMGLEHVKPEYPALMNLKTVRYVTENDLVQFDYLYP